MDWFCLKTVFRHSYILGEKGGRGRAWRSGFVLGKDLCFLQEADFFF